jgi:Phosphotransferase enzyme family
MPEQTIVRTNAELGIAVGPAVPDVSGGAGPANDAQEVLRACLEPIVAKIFADRPARIDSIERKRSEFSSFYASDIITVRLASGDGFKVFLKDFGSFDHVKDTMKERREREVLVYRDILLDAGLETARYYGSVRDETSGRFWLLLEFVEGLPISHLEFEDWVPAAGWLGRMYGYFSKHPELWENCDALMRHDAEFFQSTALQALRSVTDFSPEFGRRLDPIVGRYDKAVAVMTSQPQTFVHGTYRPAQIIIDKSREPARICPVDFEKAAVGASFYDLTFLVDGFDPPRLKQLFEAYRAEAARSGVSVPEDEEMKRVVDCFRLHRVMSWLSLSLARGYAPNAIHKLMHMAEDVAGLVL